MALTQEQIQQIKLKGKAKGYTDEQINTALIELEKQSGGGASQDVSSNNFSSAPSSQGSNIPKTNIQSPAGGSQQQGQTQTQAPAEEGGLVSRFFKSLYNTGANYVKFVGEAGAQGVRAVIDPIGDAKKIDEQSQALAKQSRDLIAQAKRTNDKAEKDRLLQKSRDIDAQIESLGDRARQIGEKKASFLLDESKISDRGQIVKTGAKATAGAASLVIPGGSTVKTAIALGAASGALYGFSEGEDIDPEKIITGAITGGITAGVLKGAEKGLSKVASKVSEKGIKVGNKTLFQRTKQAIDESLQETAEKSINKASPSAWQKGVEEKGLDLNALTKKYFKKAGASSKNGLGYDDLLGPVAERGRGGSLQTELLANEKIIEKSLSATSKNTKVPIDDFVKSLNKEIGLLKKVPGNENNIKALQAFVKATEKQYGNGITPKNMLLLKRAADSKFGQAVVDETTGSATAQAQKMFANVARKTLKKLFPEIKDALDNETEIYTLRPVLSHARGVLKTQGSGIRVGSFRGRSMSDLINPLTYIEAALANPKVASRFLGGEAEQQAAKSFLMSIPDVSPVIDKFGNAAQVAGRDAKLLSGSTGEGQVQPVEGDNAGQSGAPDNQPGDNNQSQLDHSSIVQQQEQQKQQQAAKPFGGRSKNELLQMAIAEGASLKDLKEIGDIYDMIVPESSEDVDTLLKKRKTLADAGFSTTDIDAQLAQAGVTPSQESKDIVSQIQALPSAGERNKAVATKDILDVVNNAIETVDAGAPTGPLSALAAIFSKLYEPNETAQLEKDLTEILRTIRKESTGVQFSPQEIKDLEKEIPTIVQQEGNVKDSLTRLRVRMLQKLENSGIDTSGEYGEQ